MINMTKCPLRYKICRWPQAVNCLSNNSRNLYISVNELVQNEVLTGVLIKVEHTELGTLFAAMVRGEGQIVTKDDEEGNHIPWMTTSQILQQLAKFGFYIIYNQISSLDDDILDELMQVRDLGFDKLNQIVVQSRKEGSKVSKKYTVAMKTKGNEDLLIYGAHVSELKFNNRLASSKMIVLLEDSTIEWSWVDSLYNISDILQENADIEKFAIDDADIQDLTHSDEIHPTNIPEGFTLYDELDTDQED